MAGLLQEAAGPLAGCPQKVPMAKSVCGNSRPPQEFYAEIIAVQAKLLLFSRPEPAARPIALSHILSISSLWGRHMGLLCALNQF